MSIVSKTTLKSYFETGDFPTQAQFENLIDTLYPYERWDALVTQTGTDAPTFTINSNTLGGTISWAYTGVGIYRGTLAGAFPVGKVEVFWGQNSSFFVGWRRLSDNIIEISCYDNTAANANDLFVKTGIEIRVYP